MKRSAWAAFGLAGAMLAPACAADIRPDDPLDSGPSATGKMGVADNGDGSHTVHINASDPETWVYISLGQLRLIETDEPSTSGDWDLGLQRFHYALDGGISGAGQGELSIVEEAVLIDVTLPPDDGWSTDEPDAAEEGVIAYAFETAGDGWYDYDGSTHILTPKKRVYVVRGAAGDLFALQIVSYYSDVGSSGWPKFIVKPL